MKCKHNWTPYLDIDEFLEHGICYRFCLNCKKVEWKAIKIEDGVINESKENKKKNE